MTASFVSLHWFAVLCAEVTQDNEPSESEDEEEVAKPQAAYAATVSPLQPCVCGSAGACVIVCMSGCLLLILGYPHVTLFLQKLLSPLGPIREAGQILETLTKVTHSTGRTKKANMMGNHPFCRWIHWIHRRWPWTQLVRDDPGVEPIPKSRKKHTKLWGHPRLTPLCAEEKFDAL